MRTHALPELFVFVHIHKKVAYTHVQATWLKIQIDTRTVPCHQGKALSNIELKDYSLKKIFFTEDVPSLYCDLTT